MTETVTGFLTTKSSFYIGSLIFIGCISPFIHVIYGVSDAKGYLGYTYMSSFLNAVGRINALLCAALFIKFAASKLETSSEYKHAVNFGANMFLYVACFFVVNLFIPKKELFNKADFPAYYYWISMVILSISTGVFLSIIQKAIIASEEKLKNIIRSLFDFVLGDLEDEQMIKEDKISVYKEKSLNLLKNALDNE